MVVGIVYKVFTVVYDRVVRVGKVFYGGFIEFSSNQQPAADGEKSAAESAGCDVILPTIDLAKRTKRTT